MRSKIIFVFILMLSASGAWVAHRMHLNFHFLTEALADSPPALPPPPAGNLPADKPLPPPPAAPNAAAATLPPPASAGAPLPPPVTAAPAVNPPAPTTPNAPATVGGIKFGDQDFIYDPSGRRDPFKPYFTIDKSDYNTSLLPLVDNAPAAGNLPFLRNENQPGEGLEAYETSKFKLVGIMWEVNDPKAMVQAPQGKTYMVRKQTRIGRSNGYVAAIREGEIVVVEVSSDGKTPSTRVLSLQK